MKVSAPIHVEATRKNSPLRGELTLRYAAAYACTLIAVLAAQLYITSPLVIFLLGSIVLGGWPLSLAMRNRMRPEGVDIGNGRIISRLAISSAVVILWHVAFLAFLGSTLGINGGTVGRLFATDARTVFGLIMEYFLIFACCRCLAILNDKDAALSTLPTYAVLLLLMVVLNGAQEIVLYFFAWMAGAATLLALDHRAESRSDATGIVPSIVPGQDVSMSARGLGTIVASSSLCAIVLSSLLSNGDPGERSVGEGMIAALASRLSGLALNLPDVSVNAGPERQIDFTTGPSLPTRAELWRVRAFDIATDEPVDPLYWRMFTYGEYDGHSWSQIGGQGKRIAPSTLDQSQWPFNEKVSERNQRFVSALMQRRGFSYNIASVSPDVGGPSRQFGTNNRETAPMQVAQYITAITENVGYIPALPSPRSVVPPPSVSPNSAAPNSSLTEDTPILRVRNDYALDLGVVHSQDKTFLWSEVTSPEYGNTGVEVPLKRSALPNSDAKLTAEEFALYTKLPKDSPPRLKLYAQKFLKNANAQENNYARAKRLLVAIQDGATYTLRPPIPPENRDATDYFLNEGGKRGYCTYFASALTVLCRESGIPARVVTGFVAPEAQGDGSYLIRESMSHAWTEVWVPGWGWATLDATPASDRGNNAPGLWDNALAFLGSVLEEARVLFQSYRLPVLGLGGFVLILGLYSFGARTAHHLRLVEEYLPYQWMRRNRRLSPDELVREDALRLYHRTSRRLGQSFRRRAGWETPVEWLQGAEASLTLPDWTPLQRLTDLYIRARYSPAPISPDEVATLRKSLAKFVWKPSTAKK